MKDSHLENCSKEPCNYTHCALGFADFGGEIDT